jgi:hypothetical protein
MNRLTMLARARKISTSVVLSAIIGAICLSSAQACDVMGDGTYYDWSSSNQIALDWTTGLATTLTVYAYGYNSYGQTTWSAKVSVGELMGGASFNIPIGTNLSGGTRIAAYAGASLYAEGSASSTGSCTSTTGD